MTDDRVLMASDLPFELRMCPHLRPPREAPPVQRVRTPAGDEAWLVSGFTQVRALLTDDRVGRSHPKPDERAQYAGNPGYDQVTATDHTMADALHGLLREALAPHFTARRMLAMRPRLQELVDDQVIRLHTAGAPADLNEDFSIPLVLRVICELLGVPEEDQDQCVELMRRVESGDVMGLAAYFGQLIVRLRAEPDESLLSKLTASGAPDEQVVQVAMLLQFAGLGATVKQIAYGFLLLAGNTEQRAALQANPDLVPDAVEEMLRLSGSLSLPRYARADVEIANETVRDGDLVLLDLTAANYDPDGFDSPEDFRLDRTPNRHLTFSHGVWTCLGAPLARVLLRTVVATMLTTELRPAGALEHRSGPLTGGLPEKLPVTW
ncbi:cytochrome P450 [Actinophytocola algeriensis]|uniref:Cytochrome P450 monooxygenase n=1 Tax=Actinophytocola algeriensis TaxID=1768010 RepID=A0A7W7VIH1_9PSEU|nr:cytochrome P450 [Actinophytocola algeriensis]MBB4911536.1 cytochrome P450 monooxygenase [Actinophytocola algeriensis]MBE1473476.1 cytochrome P450 monooxygenase [Actinophytocola algeriensis]